MTQAVHRGGGIRNSVRNYIGLVYSWYTIGTSFDVRPSIIQGPSGADVFRPRDWGNASDKVANDITLEVTRITLALGVFAIGIGKSSHRRKQTNLK